MTAVQRTLSIIKPDATRRNLTGKINAKFEEKGLRIVAQKRIRLSEEQAGKFYEVHKEHRRQLGTRFGQPGERAQRNRLLLRRDRNRRLN